MMDDVTGHAIPLGELEMSCPEGRFIVDVYQTLPPIDRAESSRLLTDATGTLFRLTETGYVQASPDGEFRREIQKFFKLVPVS